MIAPLAVEPPRCPRAPPTAAPVVAPMTAPRSVLLKLAHPASPVEANAIMVAAVVSVRTEYFMITFP
jgi:hypothetical protein